MNVQHVNNLGVYPLTHAGVTHAGVQQFNLAVICGKTVKHWRTVHISHEETLFSVSHTDNETGSAV